MSGLSFSLHICDTFPFVLSWWSYFLDFVGKLRQMEENTSSRHQFDSLGLIYSQELRLLLGPPVTPPAPSLEHENGAPLADSRTFL